MHLYAAWLLGASRVSSKVLLIQQSNSPLPWDLWIRSTLAVASSKLWIRVRDKRITLLQLNGPTSWCKDVSRVSLSFLSYFHWVGNSKEVMQSYKARNRSCSPLSWCYCLYNTACDARFIEPWDLRLRVELCLQSHFAVYSMEKLPKQSLRKCPWFLVTVYTILVN